MAISLNILKFQDAATSAGNGQELKVINGLTLTLSITGTATARNVIFEAKGEIGDYVPILGYNSKTAKLSTETSGITDETWVFDLIGYNSFRVRINSISGGNLSATGKLVG